MAATPSAPPMPQQKNGPPAGYPQQQQPYAPYTRPEEVCVHSCLNLLAAVMVSILGIRA